MGIHEEEEVIKYTENEKDTFMLAKTLWYTPLKDKENKLQTDSLKINKHDIEQAIFLTSKEATERKLITGPYLGFWKFETPSKIGWIEIFKWP
jgi:hypothetical protein